jgi:hypothetical protein
MTLIQKIQQAQSKKELDNLNYEIIFQHTDFNQNQKAYVKRLEELKNNENSNKTS